MFDLSITKILVLAVLAVVIFGPDQLPKIAMQAGRTLRELRRLADGAKSDLREGLGPEFANFEVSDLNPRNFVRKHLLDELDLEGMLADPPAGSASSRASVALAPGETQPFDAEAT